MISWLLANLGTIITLLVLTLIVMLIVRGMVNDRRKGVHSCGGKCGGACASCGACSACASGRGGRAG